MPAINTQRVSKSILIFGYYSMLMGLVLLFIPKMILPIVGIPATHEPWVFLLGFVLCCSSYYYIRAARIGDLNFAKWTLHTRLAAPIVVLFLFLSDRVEVSFLPFGFIDGLGGLWTLWAFALVKGEVKHF